MGVFKRRSRQVAFRISEDEYGKLLNFCMSSGVRSISDFARLAVCQFTASTERLNNDPLVDDVRKLGLRVKQLDRKLEDLSSLVRTAAERSRTGAVAQITTGQGCETTSAETAHSDGILPKR